MKTTVKLGAGKAITVQPPEKGTGVLFQVSVMGILVHSELMTVDTWAALSFGGDQAAEASEIRQQREAQADE